MINAAQIEYVDVHSAFFDMDIKNIQQYAFIFDDEEGFRIKMNHVISKPYAIEKAFKMYQSEKNAFTQLYVSRDAIKVRAVKDYLNQSIFEKLDEDISGWLFFFDLVPFANWEHPCSYLFLIDENNYEKKEYNRGLSAKIQMEKLY